jgi:hypothetical protein
LKAVTLFFAGFSNVGDRNASSNNIGTGEPVQDTALVVSAPYRIYALLLATPLSQGNNMVSNPLLLSAGCTGSYNKGEWHAPGFTCQHTRVRTCG